MSDHPGEKGPGDKPRLWSTFGGVCGDCKVRIVAPGRTLCTGCNRSSGGASTREGEVLGEMGDAGVARSAGAPRVAGCVTPPDATTEHDDDHKPVGKCDVRRCRGVATGTIWLHFPTERVNFCARHCLLFQQGPPAPAGAA